MTPKYKPSVILGRKLCALADLYDDRSIKTMVWFIQLLFFQIYEIAMIITMAYIINIHVNVIISLICFLPFRITNRGYHAKTKLGCIILSTASFLLIGLIGNFIGVWISPILGVLFALILRK